MFGFVLEARGMVRAGPIFRLIGVAIYFGREVPFFSTFKNHGTLGVCLRTALLTLMTGMICQAAFPQYAVVMEHIILVGGFGLLTLTVATRVHSGPRRSNTPFQSQNKTFGYHDDFGDRCIGHSYDCRHSSSDSRLTSSICNHSLDSGHSNLGYKNPARRFANRR